MNNIKMLNLNLRLFDGEGGAAAGAPAAAGGQAATGENTGSPASTQQGKKTAETEAIIYGKQPESTEAGNASPDTSEARRAEYDKLIKGEYKDFYTADTQKMIDRRFREAKALEAQNAKLKPVMDKLAERYGLQYGDVDQIIARVGEDSELLSEAAAREGYTDEQYAEVTKMRRENAVLKAAQNNEQARAADQQRVEALAQQASALKAKYANFDLKTELEDPEFRDAILKGVPMEVLYLGKHFSELAGSATVFAAEQGQKAAVDNIRARGQRPHEAGASASRSTARVKSDPRNLTAKDFRNIEKLVAGGAKISF